MTPLIPLQMRFSALSSTQSYYGAIEHLTIESLVADQQSFMTSFFAFEEPRLAVSKYRKEAEEGRVYRIFLYQDRSQWDERFRRNVF